MTASAPSGSYWERRLPHPRGRHPCRLSNPLFLTALFLTAICYPLLLAALAFSTVAFPRDVGLWAPWQDPALRFAAGLSLVTSLASGIIGLAVALPCGYVMSRYRFPGWRLVDILLYLPIVLPPLVIGVSLLIFFRTPLGRLIEEHGITFTFAVPGIILAQTVVGASYAVRIVKLAFDGASPRRAGIARTLGASRWQAFWRIEFSEARSGLLEAFVLSWATALGAFGPVALFCGTTRMRTEVLSSSIFLEFSIGHLDRALVLSIWIGAFTAIVLLVTRLFGRRPLW